MERPLRRALDFDFSCSSSSHQPAGSCLLFANESALERELIAHEKNLTHVCACNQPFQHFKYRLLLRFGAGQHQLENSIT